MLFQLKSEGVNNKRVILTFKSSGYNYHLNKFIENLNISFKLFNKIFYKYISIYFYRKEDEIFIVAQITIL